jgi:hypothetical protein
MKCPSILDLTSAESCSDPHLRAHIKNCPRCRALRCAWHSLPNDAAEFPAEELPKLSISSWTPRANPAAAALSGAIHTVSTPGEDIFLLGLIVDLGEEQATIFPLSLETNCAGDWDILLAPAVLGYPAIIEAWNQIDVLAEQLREQLALVPDAESVIDLYDRALVGEPAPPELPQGPPLSSGDDPRHAFREREHQRVRPYAEPARRMNAAATMGALLRQARVEQGRKEAEVAVAIGLEASELRRLEEDQEDLRARIPINRFADLLDELEFLPSRALFRYVEEAAFANDREPGEEAGKTPTYARRRTGVRAGRQPAPEDERRRRAHEWVAQLAAELDRRHG